MWNNGNMVASVEFSVALGYNVLGELLSSVASFHVSEASAACLICSMSLSAPVTSKEQKGLGRLLLPQLINRH